MAASIQQIDGRSVHHIQSGQVINDGLNSAVKELVENALDAHATSIEIRFKNYGLESLEVIDNGEGISPNNYESIALKHYTSKLRTYSDLDSVTTFGFRGEALSSLCALSDFYIITATVSEVPKGSKLEFENSGKLKSKSIVAASKGTTVCVGNLFKSLPVRRRELERNIKRDYAKALGLLQAYASICTGVKFSVFNQPSKGKRTPAFATKGNPTTRENISNVFGSKTLVALVPLDLHFQMHSVQKPSLAQPAAQTSASREVKIVGHISRPVVGEGRNAPDRQMFFVNGRPCILPQITKAFNEVYKGFNVTQSPFVFADLLLDTNSYDVNVSPDKRTILLHDQAGLLENLKASLTELFEKHEQTLPVTQLGSMPKLPSYRQPNLLSSVTNASLSSLRGRKGQWVKDTIYDSDTLSSPAPASRSYTPRIDENEDIDHVVTPKPAKRSKEAPKYDLSGGISQFAKNAPLPFKAPTRVEDSASSEDSGVGSQGLFSATTTAVEMSISAEEGSQEQITIPVEDLPSSQQILSAGPPLSPRPAPSRSQRRIDTPATITIGDRTPVTSGRELPESPRKKRRLDNKPGKSGQEKNDGFVSILNKFMAPGTQTSSTGEGRVTGPSNNSWGSEDTVGEDDYDSDDMMEQVSMESDNQECQGKQERDYLSEDDADITPQDTQREESRSKVAGSDRCEEKALDDRPLFLPGYDSDGGQDGEDDGEVDLQEPETLEGPEASPVLPKDDDGDYTPQINPSQWAEGRAARLLREVEEYEISSPIDQLLERNFRIFNDCQFFTTTSTVRFEQVSLDEIRRSAQNLRAASKIRLSNSTGSYENALSSQDEVAEQRLTLTVSKEDFFNMKIRGQFNKGFIIATRENELFIIDQHASDEKYNFETLQATTVVQNQPLVIPRNLNLMAMDEIAVMDNLDVLKRNGFVVDVDPEMPTGHRCKLVSLPMSRETIFGVEDLEELVHLIHQHQGSGTSHLRCSKVRSMFAMRACRKSVMVGKALPIKAMEKIVRHMGELDKPWNCPHGRPTMRHLAELSYVDRWTERDERRGGGGLQWGGEGWMEVMNMYAEKIGGR